MTAISAALAFYTFLFAPVAASLGITLITPTQVGLPYIYNDVLLAWKLLIVVPPIAYLLLSARTNTRGSATRTLVNEILLASFFTVLIVATYFVSDLYPYYI